MSCIVWDYSHMATVKIIVVLTQVKQERDKNKRWAHLGKGINPESSGREKKNTLPPPQPVTQSARRGAVLLGDQRVCV